MPGWGRGRRRDRELEGLERTTAGRRKRAVFCPRYMGLRAQSWRAEEREDKRTGKPGIPKASAVGEGVGVVIWGLSTAQGTG